MPGSPVVHHQIPHQDRQRRKDAAQSSPLKTQGTPPGQTGSDARLVSPGKVAGPGNGFSALAHDGNGYKVPGLPASALNGATRSNGHNGTAHASTSNVALQDGDDDRRALFFEPQSWRKWQKSRRKEEDGQEMPSVDELLAQLRPEENDLIPLNAIAGRVVHYAWQLFANQVEINPSLDPIERRRRIYEDAHEARKQLIKLLVLVQWSNVAPELLLARNLIVFINEHMTQVEVAVSSLAETRSILSSARLRKYDLSTAIEVLSCRSPQTIAPSLRELIHVDERYTDGEAIALVRELDDVLRSRLASEEILPLPMLSYNISDGRVCFVAEDLFEADLTLSGDSAQDRWWLLRVKFDFTITGTGSERFQRQLRGQQRLNLLALADAELAPRSVAAAAGDAEAHEKEDEVAERFDETFSGDTMTTLRNRKDTPLVRLYNLLQAQSLHYRLDILYWQAAQMSKLSWGQNVQAYIDEDRVLHLRYWRKVAATQGQSKDDWNPVRTSELRISVIDEETKSGTMNTIKSLLEKNDDRRQKVAEMSLTAEWDTEGAVNDYLEGDVIEIDHHALDALALVREATKRHASAAIDAFKARMEDSVLSRTMRFEKRQRSLSNDADESLLIDVHDHFTVELSIDYVSGRLSLIPFTDTSEFDVDDAFSCPALATAESLEYVREASAAISADPSKVVRVLQKVRRQLLMKELERKATMVNLPFTTRLPLRQVDYAQLQGSPGSILFIAMQQYVGYYLVLRTGEDAMHVSLILAATLMDNLITTMRIVSFERLDWSFILRACNSRSFDQKVEQADGTKTKADINEEDLAILHSYSVALIGYHKIEEQLRQRNLPFLHVNGLTGRRAKADTSTATHEGKPAVSSLIASVVPSLCLDARSILRDFIRSGLVKRNVLLRLTRWDNPAMARAEFVLRISLPAGIVTKPHVADGPDEITFNAKDSLLTFTLADQDNALVQFLAAWRRFEMIYGLVKTLSSLQNKADDMQSPMKVRLKDFDLLGASFAYGQGLVANIGWLHDASLSNSGYFTLHFDVENGEGDKDGKALADVNPHLILAGALQRTLNSTNIRKSSTVWHAFLHLLYRTLPLARFITALQARHQGDINVAEVEIKSAFWIRLTFKTRFMLDVRTLRDRTFLFVDANAGKGDAITSLATVTDADQTDEFTLAHPIPTLAITDTVRKALRWSQLPGFTEIAQALAKEQRKAEDQKKNLQTCLAFDHGLLFRGDPERAAEILESFVDKITSILSDVDV